MDAQQLAGARSVVSRGPAGSEGRGLKTLLEALNSCGGRGGKEEAVTGSRERMARRV